MQGETEKLLARAKAASNSIRMASSEQKNDALLRAAEALNVAKSALMEANEKDIEIARANSRPASFIDRLTLTDERITAMADAVAAIADLPDPVGRLLHETERPNGLHIQRVAVPIGIIAMIYEARPNVGSDAGALCLKSGNVVILRAGSESIHSARVITNAMQEGLKAAGLPAHAIQSVESPNREIVGDLLGAQGQIDLVIPRGGKSLVARVASEAKVATLLHLDGNCHSYIHEDANIEKALKILANAKLRRTGICGATESLVIDRAVAAKVIPRLSETLPNTLLVGDACACSLHASMEAADPSDWGTEYLDAKLSVKIVDDLEAAIQHINRYSSGHTEAILTENLKAAERFLDAIDSAIVMHNASTQFADGGEFGMGAEIGIATGKMHARGPVGLEQLTSFKYRVKGQGQIRP